MFCYSIRRGTRAEKMENQIDEKTKVERLERLKKCQNKTSVYLKFFINLKHKLKMIK